MCNNFILVEKIWPDWVFKEMFRINKSFLLHKKTERVVSLPVEGVPRNGIYHGTDLCTDTRICSLIATMQSGGYSCVFLGHVLSVSQMRRICSNILNYCSMFWKVILGRKTYGDCIEENLRIVPNERFSRLCRISLLGKFCKNLCRW